MFISYLQCIIISEYILIELFLWHTQFAMIFSLRIFFLQTNNIFLSYSSLSNSFGILNTATAAPSQRVWIFIIRNWKSLMTIRREREIQTCLCDRRASINSLCGFCTRIQLKPTLKPLRQLEIAFLGSYLSGWRY